MIFARPTTKPPKPAPPPKRTLEGFVLSPSVFNELMALNHVPLRMEVTQDPEELPDDQIVPDNTDPLPDEPEIKTDPVDDE